MSHGGRYVVVRNIVQKRIAPRPVKSFVLVLDLHTTIINKLLTGDGDESVANSLSSKCDWLGVSEYFGAVVTEAAATAKKLLNATCLQRAVCI